MTSTTIIARREFRSYFDSPIAYVVICLSLIIIGLFVFSQFWTINRASLGGLFEYTSWGIVLFIVPAITMRLLAEEKRAGTLELLITMPVRDSEVVLGKFFASLGLIVVLLVLTAVYPLMISRLGTLDPGPLFVGYFGLILLSAAAVSIGLFFSSITENQIVAFMATFVVLLVFWIMEYVGASAGGFMGDLINFISFKRRVTPFERGLLDVRNIFFFLSVTTFFLLLTIRSLESRKWK